MTKDGTEIESYIACVHGDVSGDGKIDVLDMEKIQKSILNIERLTGVYQQAGLLSGEDMLSVMDMEPDTVRGCKAGEITGSASDRA